MGRIAELFKRKHEQVLNVYCTAGYPGLENTMEVIHALQRNGADLVEIGMPYSDPLADGPVIQESGNKALENGMTIEKLMQQLLALRESKVAPGMADLPVILMGYMNPVLQYGFERFCQSAAAVGVDGLILPDLPQYEFEQEYGAIIKKYGLDFIFLVTPETAEARIRKLDELSTGFLYAVSSSSTTGKDKNLADQSSYFDKLQSMKLKNPVLIGFGIKDQKTFKLACSYANGAIIGSAYIQALKNTADIDKTTKEFLQSVLNNNF